MDVSISATCLRMSAARACWNGRFSIWPDALRAELEPERGVVQRGAQRPGDGLHLGDARGVEDRLGHPFEQDHVGRVAHIVVGFDHHQFRVEPGLGEMPFGSGIAGDGRGAAGQVPALVVARLVAGQRQQADQGNPDAHHQDGPRPAHHRGADAPPCPGAHRSSGLQQTEQRRPL